jgi:tRNA 5-methylaminomethyl-2-thiouridine biosynthesis bifunctional protein
MEYREAWHGRERCTVLDAAHDEERLRILIDVWRTDPARSPHLHVIALCGHLLPGFHRILQPEPGLTIDLINAPFDTALAQLAARVDLFRLRGLEDAGAGFARSVARLAAPGARLVAQELGAAQVAALEDQGFVFEAGSALPPGCSAGEAVQYARFASRKPRPPVPPSCSGPASRARPPASACVRAAGTSPWSSATSVRRWRRPATAPASSCRCSRATTTSPRA